MRKIILSLLIALSLTMSVSAVELQALSPITSVSIENSRLLPPKTDTTATPEKTTTEKTTPKKTTPEKTTTEKTTDDHRTAPTSDKALSDKDAKIAAARKKVSSTNFLTSVEKSTLKYHNTMRKDLGLPAFKFDEDLQTAARIRSYELYKSDTFAHERPDGRDWFTVLKEDVPYSFDKAGENLASAIYNDPSIRWAYEGDFWTNSWIDSPDHYKTMIDPDFTHVGIGIYCTVKNGMTYAYATALFSKPK